MATFKKRMIAESGESPYSRHFERNGDVSTVTGLHGWDVLETTSESTVLGTGDGECLRSLHRIRHKQAIESRRSAGLRENIHQARAASTHSHLPSSRQPFHSRGIQLHRARHTDKRSIAPAPTNASSLERQTADEIQTDARRARQRCTKEPPLGWQGSSGRKI
jgi:hypothetical protein